MTVAHARETLGAPPPPKHWRVVPVGSVRGKTTGPSLDAVHVNRLLASFSKLGAQLMLRPLIVDEHLRLLDGAHRLEAARQAGWSHVAVVVCAGADERDATVMQLEADRVRRRPSPLELEEAWRAHFEPELRRQARARQLQGLRRSRSAAPVLGNSNNELNRKSACSPSKVGSPDALARCDFGDPVCAEEPTSVAQAAKEITGLSIDTLNKISQIRAIANSDSTPAELRLLASDGLVELARVGAAVDPVFRRVQLELQVITRQRPHHPGSERAEVARKELERTLVSATRLAERLSGTLAHQLETAAGSGRSEAEQLRAVRVALTNSLGTIAAIECRLDNQQDEIAALRLVGAEVSRGLKRASLDLFGRVNRHVA